MVGYQLAPVPMAGLDVDGTVVVANRAFARFLGCDASASVEGASLFESALAEVYPEFAADVARVHDRGKVLQRLLAVEDSHGNPVSLLVSLVPGVEDAGKVHLTIQSADSSER